MLDSYAHHPTELAADLRAAREITRRRGGRVIAVFQPHLYSRTRIFAAEFGAALGLADEAVVLDVYAAREDPEPGVTGRLVADAVPGGAAHYVADFADVPKVVAALAAPGDLVLTMGAGDITRMGPLCSPRSPGRRPGRSAGRADERRAAGRRTERRRAPSAARPRPPRPSHGGRRARRPGARRPGRPGRAPGRGGAARGRGPAGARPSSRSPGSRSWPASAGRCSATGVLVVRSVTVTGTHLLAPAQVIAAADVPLGTPLLRVDAGAVTRRVEAIPPGGVRAP